MAVLDAPDGIRIGAEEPGGRLPIYGFDEWVFEHNLGEMTGNEVRTLNFGSVDTFRAGEHLLAALYNPNLYNGDKLLIQHAWYDGEIKVMVRNLSSSTVDFGNDQISVAGFNTTTPP